MGLTKPAIEAVKRECRFICLGYLGGYRQCSLHSAEFITTQGQLPGFVKFEHFRTFLSSFFEPAYVENIRLEDFTEWYREFENAKPR